LEKLEIKYPTYIIAELTGETKHFVMQCRTKFNPERLSWPVDITLTGSSGIGVIKAGQSLEKVIAVLSPLLENNSLTAVPVHSLESFPDTGIFYLKPRQTELVKLHNKIIQSDIIFEESDFPFTAHCTLCCREKATKEIDRYFSSLDFPSTAEINCFSIYQLHNGTATRLYQFKKVMKDG
jgi:hypothetical protein